MCAGVRFRLIFRRSFASDIFASLLRFFCLAPSFFFVLFPLCVFVELGREARGQLIYFSWFYLNLFSNTVQFIWPFGHLMLGLLPIYFLCCLSLDYLLVAVNFSSQLLGKFHLKKYIFFSTKSHHKTERGIWSLLIEI